MHSISEVGLAAVDRINGLRARKFQEEQMSESKNKTMSKQLRGKIRADQMRGEIRSGQLIIKLPLEKPKLSKSGKTTIIASTHGFRKLGVRLNGNQEVYVTVNAGVYGYAAAPKESDTPV